MSLFLAPIHQIMYDKIHYTDALACAIAKKDPSTERSLDENFPSIEDGPLEEVIDTSNIHAWLNERVLLAEKRLAYAADALAEKDEKSLLEEAKAFGRREQFCGQAEDAFRLYDSRFLNGMPCDHVHSPVHAADGFAWQINSDVHSAYYRHPDLYEKIVDAWWEGLLEDTNLHFQREGSLCRII